MKIFFIEDEILWGRLWIMRRFLVIISFSELMEFNGDLAKDIFERCKSFVIVLFDLLANSKSL